MSHTSSRVRCKVVQRKTRHRSKANIRKTQTVIGTTTQTVNDPIIGTTTHNDPRVRSKVVMKRRPRTRKKAETQRALQSANERIYVLEKELGRAKRKIRLYKSILKRVNDAVREYQATDQ